MEYLYSPLKAIDIVAFKMKTAKVNYVAFVSKTVTTILC